MVSGLALMIFGNHKGEKKHKQTKKTMEKLLRKKIMEEFIVLRTYI
jgi:hypothetical protein